MKYCFNACDERTPIWKGLIYLFLFIVPFSSLGQTTIFLESIGSVTASVEVSARASGWSTTYAMTGNADIINNQTPYAACAGAVGDEPVYFPQNSTTNEWWQISGVNTNDYESLSMSFCIYKSLNAGTGAPLRVEVSYDGTSWTALSFTDLPSGGGTAGWYSRTCTGTIFSCPNLRIRFTNTSSLSNDNYRLDEVKLTGTLGCASAPSGTNGERCGTGTVSLSASGSAGTYNWYNVSSGGSSLGTASSYVTPSISTTTTYYVSAVNGACESPRAPVKATVSSLPSLSQVPTSGLMRWYKLDGNSNDASSNAYHATLQGTPTATTDRFGNATSAYSFNGTSQYITTIDAVTTANTTTTSQGLWFKTTTTTGGLLLGLGANQTGASSAHDRLLYMSPAGKLVFGYYNTVDPCPTVTTPSSYNDGNWHFVIATFSTTDGINLYVDGSLISTAAISGTPGGVNGYYYRSAYLQMGSFWPTAPTSPYYFNGTLDEIYVYNRVLSATEITTLYTKANGASNNGPVCSGGTLTLAVETISGAVSYSWTGPNSYTATTQNPTVTSMSAVKEGTYSVTVTTANPGCTSNPSYTLGKILASSSGNRTWTGSVGSNWEDAANWSPCGVPGSTEDVSIPDVTTDPVISSTANCKNLIIDASAILTINSGITLNVYGNITNNGTYTDNGTTVLIGSSAQTVTGATTFNNLTLNNSAGATLSSATTVKAILTLTSGTLAGGGNLTVNLNTGAIAGTGTGVITGNVTLYKTVNSDKYHYISSPLSGLTVADWNDDVPISLSTQYNNLYKYNETFTDTTKTVGWEAISSLSASLENMRGYALYFKGATTMDVTGNYTHSATFSNSSLTNTVSSNNGTTKASSDGWHLIGNPYPSALDWDAASGWTKTNLDNAIYFWDAANNRYATYVGGVGTNGGTQYIPSMQAFWVKANLAGGSGTLAMNNSVRVTSSNPSIWRTAASSDILKLTARNGAYNDETIIRFMEDAGEDFDSDADAYKKKSSGNTPSIYTVIGENKYSINSLPFLSGNLIVPVKLDPGFSGVYTISAEELGRFGIGDSIIFEDRLLGISQDLRANSSYTTDVAKGDTATRFYLNFRRASINSSDQSASASSIYVSNSGKNVKIKFNNISSTKATIILSNLLGQEKLFEENVDISSGEYHLFFPSFQYGIYLLKVITPEITISKKVLLNE